MEWIDTAHIKYWPKEVMLGAAEITSDLTLDILSVEELDAFNGFKNSKRKQEYISARHLFYMLMERLGLSGEKVVLKKEDSGKPYAMHNGKRVHVSFSHSPKKVYCAISLQYDIGLDVEHIHRSISQEVLKRILNRDEGVALADENPVKLWTIKEAAVKCMGTGLRTNLRELTIVRNQKKRFFVDFNNEKSFEICSFRQSDHQIALAY